MQLMCVALLSLIVAAHALHNTKLPKIFGGSRISKSLTPTSSKLSTTRELQNYAKVAALGISVLTLMQAPVLADEKSSKEFEGCMSKCVFQGTRPPPIGSTTERLEETSSKGRGEIIRECKVKCAKTKEQLLLGQPKKKVEAPTPSAAAT